MACALKSISDWVKWKKNKGWVRRWSVTGDEGKSDNATEYDSKASDDMVSFAAGGQSKSRNAHTVPVHQGCRQWKWKYMHKIHVPGTSWADGTANPIGWPTTAMPPSDDWPVAIETLETVRDLDETARNADFTDTTILSREKRNTPEAMEKRTTAAGKLTGYLWLLFHLCRDIVHVTLLGYYRLGLRHSFSARHIELDDCGGLLLVT